MKSHKSEIEINNSDEDAIYDPLDFEVENDTNG